MILGLFLVFLFVILNIYFSLAYIGQYPEQSVFALFSLIALFFIFGSVAIFLEFKRLSPLEKRRPETLPRVALVKTMCNEDAEMVEQTIISLKKANYPQNLIFIHLLDDSTDSRIRKRLSDFCANNGIEYTQRENRAGFKAGALNNFLQKCDAEFFAVFDADERLTNPDFLMDNIGFFEDEKLAAVQTNKTASPSSIFETAASAMNSIFYIFVNPVSAKNGTGSFVGSAALLRKSAIIEVGGFPTTSLVEDVALSFNLYLNGCSIMHNPKTYSQGASVGSYLQFLSQHNRYIIGMTQVLPAYFSNILRIKPGHQPFFAFQYLGLYFVSLFQAVYFLLLLHIHISGAFTEALAFASLSYVLACIAGTTVFSKDLYNSFAVGVMMYALNFSIMVNRLSALFLSFLKKAEFRPTAATPGANALKILPSILFAVPFLYFSFPISNFSLIGLPVAVLSASSMGFLLLAPRKRK